MKPRKLLNSTLRGIAMLLLVSMTYVQSMAQTQNNCGGVAYVRSVQDLWGSSGTNANIQVMDQAFGAGNWQDLRYETVDPNILFSAANAFIYMEGGDNNADELEAFIAANQTAMEAWVSAGGDLMINGAPNEGDGVDVGFGGVKIKYSGSTYYITDVVASVPGHPIFTGPFTPVLTSYSGNYFAHAIICPQALGATALIKNTSNATEDVLVEFSWGAGNVFVGGMTTTNWHSPNTEAVNLRSNMLAYLGCFESDPCANDTDPPVAICQSITAEINANGYVYVPDAALDNGSYDACGNVTFGYGRYFGCDDLGVQPATLVVYDESYNSATCQTTINVIEGSGIPYGWNSTDIGSTITPGSAGYMFCQNMWTVEHNGTSTLAADGMHLAYTEICCDASVVVKVKSIETESGVPGFAGITMRESLEPGAKSASILTRLGQWVYRRVRTVDNGMNFPQRFWSPQTNMWLKLERVGNSFIGWSRHNEYTPWVFRFYTVVPMDECIYVGLESESYNILEASVAKFGNLDFWTCGDEEGPQLTTPEDLEGLLEAEQARAELTIFPNPSKGNINLVLPEYLEEEVEIEVIDLNGKLVYRTNTALESTTINLNLEHLNLPNGLYMVNVHTSQQIISKRFVKN
jgi:hypothetical protein